MFENRQFKIADTPRSRSGKQKDIFRNVQQRELVAGLQKIFRRRSLFPIIDVSEQYHRDMMFFRQCTEKSDAMSRFALSGRESRPLSFHPTYGTACGKSDSCSVVFITVPDSEDGKFKGRVSVMRLESVAELFRAPRRLPPQKRSSPRDLRRGPVVHVSNMKKRHHRECGNRHPRRLHEFGIEKCGPLGIGNHVEREILRRAMIEIERRQSVEFAFLEAADHAVKCLESGGDHAFVLSPAVCRS